jgi:hypothetical protein
MMTKFVFDIDKTVAAAAYVARKKNGARISVFELLKTMYAAEREALASWHRPITGDSFSSMKKGIVLSRTYDLIKGGVMGTNSDMVTWSRHFSARENNCVRVLAEPDFDYLSAREREALDKGATLIAELIKRHGLIADVLHTQWPEWKNPEGTGKGSLPISVEDVLGEVIEDEDEAERVGREIDSVQSAKAALQRG